MLKKMVIALVRQLAVASSPRTLFIHPSRGLLKAGAGL
jgi:hypothetical protein